MAAEWPWLQMELAELHLLRSTENTRIFKDGNCVIIAKIIAVVQHFEKYSY